MLSVHAIGQGASGYYSSLASEDYYLEGGEPPGRWWGDALVTGMVGKEDLVSLLRGELANGTALVPVSGQRRHQPGWDLTFSAPKSVSVLWAMASREVQLLIQAIQEEAVEAALLFLEKSAARARRGHAGARLESVRLLAALFEHGTSRAQDPQLHTHALVMNVGRRADGTYGAVWSRGIYMNKMAAGALYRAELGRLLVERLGVELEQDGKSFRIRQVPRHVEAEFSKRREAIVEALLRSGSEGAVASEFAALETRSRKDALPRQELFARWQQEGGQLGFGVREAAELLQQGRERPTSDAAAPLDVEHVLAELSYHEARFTRRDVVRHLAESLQATGAGAAEVLRRTRSVLSSPEVVEAERVRGFPVYATRSMLELERKVHVLRWHLEAKKSHGVGSDAVDAAIDRAFSLRDEQRVAVRRLVEPGGVRLLSGLAGTGKTFVQRTCRELWEEAGYCVMGVAVSAKAAQELEQGSGIRSRTIASFLARSELSQVIDARTVLVVDEASMVGTRQMVALLEKVVAGGGKVVMVGDPRQLAPVEAGEPFAELVQDGVHAHLEDVQRQREPWMRNAVRSLARGETEVALQAFSAHGRLEECRSRLEAEDALVGQWGREDGKARDEALVLAATRAEVGRLNQRLQQVRMQLGELGEEHSSGSFHVGDHVLFTRNDPVVGVRNGDRGVVEAVRLGRAAQLLCARVGSRTVVFSPNRYGALELGYAVTTHKAQGATVEQALVLMGPRVEERMLYVQGSRARGETMVYRSASEL